MLYGTIFIGDLKEDYKITPKKADFLTDFTPEFIPSVIFRVIDGKLVSQAEFDEDNPFTIRAKDCETHESRSASSTSTRSLRM